MHIKSRNLKLNQSTFYGKIIQNINHTTQISQALEIAFKRSKYVFFVRGHIEFMY